MVNLHSAGQTDNHVDLQRLIEGLGGKRIPSGWTARCPAHDDRTPSLSISLRDGRVLVHCFSGCDQAAVIDELRRRDLWPSFQRQEYRPNARPTLRAAQPKPTDAGMRQFGLRMWNEAIPLYGERWPVVLTRYLHARGLDQFEPCMALRFHPRMPHGNGRYFPAMLALASNSENEPCAIQATYLREDGNGKADVEPSRKTFGSAAGCAVRLLEGDDVLVVGEGVESALSAIQAVGEGGYALLGTAGLKSIVLPEVYRDRRVIVAADNDTSGAGQKAAGEAARRLVEDQGFLDVRIVTPPQAGCDFNDRLRGAA